MRLRAITIALCTAACGMQASEARPSLADVLNKLDANRAQFARELPSFATTERATATADYGKRAPAVLMHTQSNFRVMRNAPGSRHIFKEEREIVKLEDKPAPAGTRFAGPVVPSGIFTNALAMVSFDLQRCFNYKLSFPRVENVSVIQLRFKQKPGVESPYGCPPAEDSVGTVLVDPESMQVISIEKDVPLLKFANGAVGQWIWKIEYKAVELGGRSFWLPHHITSNIRTSDGYTATDQITQTGVKPSKPVLVDHAIWGFDAYYSDFHLFRTETRILPGSARAVE